MALTIFQRADMRYLLISLYGTTIDWRSSLLQSLTAFGDAKGLQQDWAVFLDEWRSVCEPTMKAINDGSQQFENLHTMLRRRLDEMLAQIGASSVSEEARESLCGAWRRCEPWADVPRALTLLSQSCATISFSNADFGAQVAMTRSAGLTFDAHLSADLFGFYKPDPRLYARVSALLGPDPDRVFLISCHNSDLHAARQAGFGTGYIVRPRQHGDDQNADLEPEFDWDIVAEDMLDLSAKLFP